MVQPKVLRELLELFKRTDIPDTVRMSVADVLGEARYEPAKEALIAGMTHPDAAMRSSCVKALSTSWELQEIAPRLVDILLNDEFEFVRVDAATGLGAIRYRRALPSLKTVILDESHDMTLREAAYEAVLAILGRKEEDDEIRDFDKATLIDWDLVRSL
jgi:HEAT repeat protein